MLWFAIHKLWPELKRKERAFKVVPTHDVDAPFDIFLLSPYQTIHTLAGDLLKRKDINLFLHRARRAWRVKFGRFEKDDFCTFDLIMNLSEKYNWQSTFYMMVSNGRSVKDGNYDIENQAIVQLMKHILKRGHKIGIHPSYLSYKDSNVVQADFLKLKQALDRHGLGTSYIGGRQHYLRWSCPETWQYYEEAGICYDTTLSYADHIGFRCGICYEYPVFNLVQRNKLSLWEKPLIIMECSALDKRYMNLPYEKARERFLGLKEKCKKYHGDFVVLWHNNRFIKQEEVTLYERMIENNS